ncbi:hypothetical protein Gohar_007265 [Gossypium harknessii]|uniref:Uncharacterized protein n=1 Tax=Gossypium harknessii TaxID=34285 RepID=A0A7J9GFZ9_9ROSI|nr:hypothetical protein [Gossypium harknessii]
MSEGIEGSQWPEDLSDSSIGGADEEEKAMEEEKEKEEEDDEVMKDNALEPFHDDFKEAFMPTHASAIGFIIQDPSDRLNYHNLVGRMWPNCKLTYFGSVHETIRRRINSILVARLQDGACNVATWTWCIAKQDLVCHDIASTRETNINQGCFGPHNPTTLVHPEAIKLLAPFDDEESGKSETFEAQKEHTKTWITCCDTKTLCHDIGQSSEQEFYLSLKEMEARRPFYELQSSVKVRKVNALVTERSICQFYDAPYYYHNYLYKIDLKEFKNVDIEEILRFLMEGKDILTYQKGTKIHESFDQALMTPKAKF